MGVPSRTPWRAVRMGRWMGRASSSPRIPLELGEWKRNGVSMSPVRHSWEKTKSRAGIVFDTLGLAKKYYYNRRQ